MIEQELISKDIEIFGIAEQKNEDCIKITEKVSLAVGMQVSVENAFRVR